MRREKMFKKKFMRNFIMGAKDIYKFLRKEINWK